MSSFHQTLSPNSKPRRKFKTQFKRLKDKMRPRDRILLNLIDEITRSGCNPQSQSPLYRIPAEIREEIFSYVLSESDGKDAISPHDYWYRPDYPSFRYIDTNLLQICRQVWVETYTLPRRNVSPRIWLGTDERRPPRRFAYAEGVNEDILFPSSESDADRRIIHPNECLQVFAQMYALEWSQLTEAVKKASIKTSPRRLNITLRYTDWWNWEVNAPLRIADFWSKDFIAPASVEEIVLELETRNGKKPELDALISGQVSKWKFHTANEVDLVLQGKPKEKFWVGSSKPGGATYEHHSELINRSRIMGKDEMLYYTVKMRWRKAA